MKIGTFIKFRNWTQRQLARVEREIALEPNNELNYYRKRLVGRSEAYTRVVDRADALIRFHHDRWQDRRKRP